MSSASGSASSSNLSGPGKITPKSVRHVECLCWSFRFVVAQTEVGGYVRSEPISIEGLNEKAFFKVEKTSEEVVSVTCSIFSKSSDNGFFFRLYFILVGVDEEVKSAKMRFPKRTVQVQYQAASFSNSAVNENYLYSVRCVLRIVETTYASFNRRDFLNSTFQGVIRSVCKSSRISKDMAYILGRRSLNFMFTGREPQEVSFLKTFFIKRAFSYLKELLKYFKAREKSGSKLPDIPIGEILSYISEKNPMSVTACTKLFVVANQLGLTFLKVLCTHYMLANLNNVVVVEVLLAADLVEDEFLLGAATDFFLKNQTEILQTDEFKHMKDEHNEVSRRIIHRIMFRQKFPEAKPAPQLEEESSGEE